MSAPERSSRPGLLSRLLAWRGSRDELLLSDVDDDIVYYRSCDDEG